MQIQFYSNFLKRNNSTKKPTGTPSLTLTGHLKEPCSIMNPVFSIERLPTDDCPEAYVYAVIPRFGRYYFVEDWAWNDGLWECRLSEDVLASWKTYINNTTAYVERSASESNGNIIDRLYPTTTAFSTSRINLVSAWDNVAPSGGCFVLGIISKASTWAGTMVGGAVTYYVMSPGQMKSLLNYLLSDGFLDDAGFPATMTITQQLAHETAKALINPIQYIASCIWLPFPQNQITDGVNREIQLGYYDIGSNVATGQYLSAVTFTTYVTGMLPNHPFALTRGEYLNYSPYSRLSLSIHPFGMIPLDTSYRKIGNYLKCPVVIDPITGKAVLRVEVFDDDQYSNGLVITEASAQFGVPIQIAQMTPDYLGMLTSAIQAGSQIGNAISSGIPSSGDTAGLMSIPTIGNAFDALMPQIQTSGINGSFAECSPALSPVLNAQFFIPVDDDNTECGRPLCSPRLLSTLSGFVKCGEATVDFPCFSSEKEIILNHLHTGMFLE